MNLHMIGNAHLDPVWLWRWTEGCAETIGTFWSAADRLEESPEFVFTRGEAQLYDWVRRLAPPLFERVQALVEGGGWVPVGGWWVQPDCNLPCGEAFLRQALYGKAYFQLLGGSETSVGYNVDSFGHAATLPMLLRHTGYDAYVFMRPMPQDRPTDAALPRLFDWVAPDGSSVLAYRIADSYHTTFSPLSEHIERHLERMREEGLPLMCFYGVGDHGGGPTRENIARIVAGQARGEPLAFSHPARYFAEVASLNRPRLEGELQQHAVGCYSVISALKRASRRAEASLADAEAALALDVLASGQLQEPAARLEELWRTLLLNQFHDTLGGTCTARASREAHEQLSGVIAGAELLAGEGAIRLAAHLAPRPADQDAAFAVINLTGADYDGLLDYEPWLGWDTAAARQLVDETGAVQAIQEVRPESRFMGIRRLLWRAKVPAYGYRVYRYALAGKTEVASMPILTAQPFRLENSRFRLDIDPQTGALASLYDKVLGMEVFPGGGHQALLVEDMSDTWGHGVSAFGTAGTAFALEQLDLLEAGPLRQVLRVRVRAASSTLETTYILPTDPELPIELRVRVSWHERRTLLRLRYAAAPDSRCRVEVPYGSVLRPPDGRELPVQRWIHLHSGAGSVLLATDAFSSLAVHQGELHFTALRSPPFAQHEPYGGEDDPEIEFTDQGEHEFRVLILAGGPRGNAEAQRLADHLMRPPRIVAHTARGGRLPPTGQFLAAHLEGGHLAWLKPAEDGQGVILRALESEGVGGVLRLGEAEWALRPFGLHSYRLTAGGHLSECDGLER